MENAPVAVPVSILELTKEQLDAELKKGMDDISSGRVISAEEVELQMREQMDAD